MSWNEEPTSWEPTEEIIDYLVFAGVDTTRDQLARLHRRRLIGEPFHDQIGARGALARYPAGTAERMLRISQLRSSTKQLDELAWRLWWEGFDLEPDLIRTYVMKRATRWDEQLREIRTVAEAMVEEKEERDVLEEVFFEHLKVRPAMVSARKRLGRGSELYAEFSSLLIDLMRGDLTSLDRKVSGLFDRETAVGVANDHEGSSRAGELALLAMRDTMDRPFIELAASLDDKEIANARPVALKLLALIANVGSIVQEVFGGSGHGRDNVGKSLISMAENTEEQILALLLTSSFLKDDRVREVLSELSSSPAAPPTISFLDFRRLRYLAIEVPSLVALLAPAPVGEAFSSPDGADRWHVGFNEYWLSHYEELQDAMVLRPDLFAEEPLEPLEPDEVIEIEVEAKKKNLK